MTTFSIKEKVGFHSTGDPELDRATATIEGNYAEDGIIVVFLAPRPLGYNPAIVITKHCLRKI